MSTTASSTAQDPLVPLGLPFLLVVAQVIFQGVLISQSSEYFTDYWFTDALELKLFVGSTMLLSAFQTASLVTIGWYTFVTDLTLEAASEPSWVYTIQPVLAGTICALVQGFLIDRCWRILNRRTIVLYTLGFLLFLAVMSATFWTVCFGLYGSLTTKRVVKNLAISWAVFSSILNLTITIIISGYLVQNRTGLAHLDALLHKVCRFTWESAILPSLCMLAALPCIAVLPTDNVASGIFMAIAAKLECVALMRTLNARAKLRVQAVSASALGRQSLNGQLDITAIPGYETFEPAELPSSLSSESRGAVSSMRSMQHYFTSPIVKLHSLEDVIRKEICQEHPASSGGDVEIGQPSSSSSSSSPKELQSLLEVLQADVSSPSELPTSTSRWPIWHSKRSMPTGSTSSPPSSSSYERSVPQATRPTPASSARCSESTIRPTIPSGQLPSGP